MRTITFKRKAPLIKLAVCADWHWGSPQCRENGIRRFVKTIQDDDDMFWVGCGDLMENALLDSLGDVYKQKVSPDNQLYQLVQLLLPIAPKCLGFITGNHSQRTTKRVALDPDRILANLIGISPTVSEKMGGVADKYAGYSLQLVINLEGKHKDITGWRIFAHHTTGGGSTKGGKLNALVRMSNIFPLMDLYIGAHSHADQYVSDIVFHVETNKGNNFIKKYIRHFTGAGAGLDYAESYAHQKNFPPAANCQVVLILKRREHRSPLRVEGNELEYIKPFGREVIQL